MQSLQSGSLPEIKLPAGLLQQDGCIIEDQADHLVIAIRVPKTTINGNLALFAALADMSGGPPRIVSAAAAPIAAKPVRKVPGRMPTMAYAGALLAAMMLPSPLLPQISFAAAGPPVEYRAFHMAKPEFRVGEDVVFALEYHRERVCQTNYERAIQRVSDGAVVYSSRHYGAMGDITPGFKPVSIFLRDMGLKPGKYLYRGLTHSECAKGGNFDTSHEQMEFTIVP